MSEPIVDNAHDNPAPPAHAVRSGRATERARLREDFDALMATLHDAEQDLRAGGHATLPAGRAPRGMADGPPGLRSVAPRFGGGELVDGAEAAPAVQAPAQESSHGPQRPAGAVLRRETSPAVARWDDRLDQRRRDAERHVASLEDVQRRLSRALRRLGSAVDHPREVAAAGVRGEDLTAVEEALAERVRLDQGILELIASARAALQHACDELASRTHRIAEAAATEPDQRLRRDSLEHSLAALEQDSARLRSEHGDDRAAEGRGDPAPPRPGGERAALDRMLLACERLESELTERGELQSRAERLIAQVGQHGAHDASGAGSAEGAALAENPSDAPAAEAAEIAGRPPDSL